jgi:signal transduction histidine kinase
MEGIMASVILNVDDDPAGLYAKSRILRAAGYTVIEARSGQEALRQAETMYPQLIVLDVRLPDISGIEVCRRIKTNPDLQNILVMQVSASFVSTLDRTRGLEGGADAYLVEPIDPAEFIANVKALLRLRAAEEALIESDARYHAIFQTAAVGIMEEDFSEVRARLNLLREHGVADVHSHFLAQPEDLHELLGTVRILEVNEAALAMLEVESRVQLQERMADLFFKPSNEMFLMMVVACATGKKRVFWETIVRTLHGQVLHVMCYVTFLRPDPQVVRAIKTIVNITERKRIEETLLETSRKKDEFLAVLAHELRNPLAPISNAVEMLQQIDTPCERLSQARDLLARQVSHMRRLVDDLLDISRISRGLVSIRKEPMAIGTAVARAVENVVASLDAKQQRLDVDIPPQDIVVAGDCVRLVQVISNVLDNAAKYTPVGGTIGLSVHSDAGNEEVVITVRDDGIGIAPEMLPQIFNMFAQADKGLARSTGGLGVGLSLVKGIVNLHDGRVEADSAGLGQGAAFRIYLPIMTAHFDAMEKTAETKPSVPTPRRVLLVDDNADSVESLGLILQTWGHQVAAATESQKALGLATEFRPDVIVLDIGMPDMDGYEIARYLVQKSATPRPCLVALSGYSQDEDRKRAFEAGFNHYLVKPVDFEQLRVLLATAPAIPE